eukprot:TRINITY_DN3394_c0_g1_i1.p1 TRINITY_DN3394_c0_g1~~TRINITY_DN3394_c0_g1_i1.p1  ORF type:complete len:435 (+),score=107.26 TRINITY_DN3394_c0_g1_i1:122-1426(+)
MPPMPPRARGGVSPLSQELLALSGTVGDRSAALRATTEARVLGGAAAVHAWRVMELVDSSLVREAASDAEGPPRDRARSSSSLYTPGAGSTSALPPTTPPLPSDIPSQFPRTPMTVGPSPARTVLQASPQTPALHLPSPMVGWHGGAPAAPRTAATPSSLKAKDRPPSANASARRIEIDATPTIFALDPSTSSETSGAAAVSSPTWRGSARDGVCPASPQQHSHSGSVLSLYLADRRTHGVQSRLRSPAGATPAALSAATSQHVASPLSLAAPRPPPPPPPPPKSGSILSCRWGGVADTTSRAGPAAPPPSSAGSMCRTAEVAPPEPAEVLSVSDVFFAHSPRVKQQAVHDFFFIEAFHRREVATEAAVVLGHLAAGLCLLEEALVRVACRRDEERAFAALAVLYNRMWTVAAELSVALPPNLLPPSGTEVRAF